MNHPLGTTNRREFLRTTTGIAFAAALGSRSAAAQSAPKPLFSAMGVAASIKMAAELKAEGTDFLTENTGSFLVPDQADEVFAKNLARLKEECNYINHIGEAASLIRAADHPHIRVLADLYHMARMGDTPADLKAAMDVVVHVEIAEKKDRTVPGVAGDDFRPYFGVLRAAGYQGAINIEGKWTTAQIGPAFREIARQSTES